MDGTAEARDAGGAGAARYDALRQAETPMATGPPSAHADNDPEDQAVKMGLLDTGTAFPWNEAKKHADYIRQHGISQFISIYRNSSQRTDAPRTWGDELEYAVVAVDHAQKTAKLSIRQEETLEELEKLGPDEELRRDGIAVPAFHPECGRFMIESVPGEPYTPSIMDLLTVEKNMHHRRRLARSKLRADEIPLTLASFPRLGASGGPFLDPHHEPNGPISDSLFLPDELMNPHVRYSALLENIRARRGSKVEMHIPVFRDTRTPSPFLDPSVPARLAASSPRRPEHIYLDATGFGTGCCCLQATIQAASLPEARKSYDTMLPLTPILLALGAAAPSFKGYLADVDCRWRVLIGAADDRTEEERGLKPLENSRFRMPKSPYEGVSLYISPKSATFDPDRYNDLDVPIDQDIKRRLVEEGGVDATLADHVGHLFVRDPLLVLSEKLVQDDERDSNHFDNIKSTNWASLRFKPPPPGSTLGWRTEFRTIDVQLTDFENAAFAIFLVLVVRAFVALSSAPSPEGEELVGLYVPISKVDENMKRAEGRDACRKAKFWWRKNRYARSPSTSGPVEDEYEEASMDEIINGDQAKGKPGLMGLVRNYLDEEGVDEGTKQGLEPYLDLISGRASGKYLTAAAFIRNFITSHPSYEHDSVVNPLITYDLIVLLNNIERGLVMAPELLGPAYPLAGVLTPVRPSTPTPAPVPAPVAAPTSIAAIPKLNGIDKPSATAETVVETVATGGTLVAFGIWKLFAFVIGALVAGSSVLV